MISHHYFFFTNSCGLIFNQNNFPLAATSLLLWCVYWCKDMLSFTWHHRNNKWQLSNQFQRYKSFYIYNL